MCDSPDKTMLSSERTMRAVLTVVVFILWAVYAARTAIGIATNAVDAVLGLCLAIAVIRACIADGRVVGRPILRAAYLPMLFTWPIAVPIYLLWSRGPRGVVTLIVLIASLAIAILMSVTIA